MADKWIFKKTDETPFNHVITPQTLQPADPARVGQSERVIHDRERHEQQKWPAVLHFQWELGVALVS